MQRYGRYQAGVGPISSGIVAVKDVLHVLQADDQRSEKARGLQQSYLHTMAMLTYKRRNANAARTLTLETKGIRTC